MSYKVHISIYNIIFLLILVNEFHIFHIYKIYKCINSKIVVINTQMSTYLINCRVQVVLTCCLSATRLFLVRGLRRRRLG